MTVTMLLLACSNNATPPPAAPAGPDGPESEKPTTVTLTVEKDSEEDPNVETPTTTLRMKLSGGMSDSFELIMANGSCTGSDPEPPLLIELNCWWAGAGDTVRIASTDGAIVVTHARISEEMEGTPEFTEVQRVAVPAGLTVVLGETGW